VELKQVGGSTTGSPRMRPAAIRGAKQAATVHHLPGPCDFARRAKLGLGLGPSGDWVLCSMLTSTFCGRHVGCSVRQLMAQPDLRC